LSGIFCCGETPPLDRVEAEAAGAARRAGERLDDTARFVAGERARRRLVRCLRHRRRGHRLPASLLRQDQCAAVPGFAAGGLAAGVPELDTERRARVAAHCAGDALERALVRVRVEAEARRRDPADRIDRSRLDQNQPSAAQRKRVHADK